MASLPRMMPRLRGDSARTGRIDRLGWQAGTCFDAYGLRVGVRFNAVDLLDRLPPHLPPGWRPARRRSWTRSSRSGCPLATLGRGAWAGCTRANAGGPSWPTWARRSRCSSPRCDRASPRRPGPHVRPRGRRGMAWPRHPRAGAQPKRQDDARGGARPHRRGVLLGRVRGPRPPRACSPVREVALHPRGSCARHEVVFRRRAEDLGGSCGVKPLPVCLVALASYRPGATWRPATLTKGQAVLEMLAHTVPARLRPEASLVALERAVARATVLRGERGEAPEIAARLIERVEESEEARRLATGTRGTR